MRVPTMLDELATSITADANRPRFDGTVAVGVASSEGLTWLVCAFEETRSTTTFTADITTFPGIDCVALIEMADSTSILSRLSLGNKPLWDLFRQRYLEAPTPLATRVAAMRGDG